MSAGWFISLPFALHIFPLFLFKMRYSVCPFVYSETLLELCLSAEKHSNYNFCHTLLLRTEDCSCLYLGFSFGQYGFNINLKHNPKALKAHSTSRRFVLFIFSNGSAGPVTYVTPGPIPIPFPPRSQFIFPIFPMISDCCANRKVPFGNGADIVPSVLVNASLRPCQ